MIIILTPFWNVEKYVEKCINSIKSQTIKDFKCFLINDISTDNSFNIIQNLIKDDNRFILSNNINKTYQGGNYYNTIHSSDINNEDICITLDADDWFADEYVLERVIIYYSNPNIWITCGQFQLFDGHNYTQGFTAPPKDWNNIRRNPGFTYSHMRTFKAHLFRRIKKEDMIISLDKFWETTADLSFMYPMLEMAGKNRSLFVNDINYIYNTETPFNEYKTNMEKVNMYSSLGKNKQPYILI
jgi:glycosyltransferase involved in cell wall biosynthesis